MFHIIYKTVEPSTGRYYYGKHSTTTTSDGYQGSGRWVLRALAKGRHLITGTVAEYPTAAEALAAEKALVTEELIADPLCMNQTVGGRGSFAHLNGANITPEDRQRMRDVALRVFTQCRRLRGVDHQFWGIKRPDHSAKMAGKSNPFYGKKHSSEVVELMRAKIDPEQRAAVATGNTNVRGRRWWNDGTRSYMLMEDAAMERGLVPGRIWKTAV
jgi:hypothetical protein